jgi:hypothetical protein
MSNTEVSFKSVKSIVQAGYACASSRRKVRVFIQKTYLVSNYWDGGSRNYCEFVNLENLETASGVKFNRQTQGNPYNQDMGTVEITPDFVVVEHIIFCGKDLGYRIYVHPSALAKIVG